MSATNQALYRCTLCPRTWSQLPSHQVQCSCGELYVEWLNYRVFRDSAARSQEYRDHHPLGRKR